MSLCGRTHGQRAAYRLSPCSQAPLTPATPLAITLLPLPRPTPFVPAMMNTVLTLSLSPLLFCFVITARQHPQGSPDHAKPQA